MPETRPVELAAGIRCWIRLDYPSRPGKGPEAGAEAVVLNPCAEDGLVEIECRGVRWLAAPCDLDFGCEYLTQMGQWISESDPLFRDWAHRELRKVRQSGSASPDADPIRRLVHVLDRNHWPVPRWCK